MTTYFSAENIGFYDDRIRPMYDENGSWPADAKEVSDEILSTYMASPAIGKMLGSDDSGLPAWVDTPPPSKDEEIAAAEYEKTIKINAANTFINNKQWPSKLTLDRINENERIRFIAWLDYLDGLEGVDTTEPKGIIWPEIPS